MSFTYRHITNGNIFGDRQMRSVRVIGRRAPKPVNLRHETWMIQLVGRLQQTCPLPCGHYTPL